jgi:flagellar motility protein MotE (MotC chaperone)
MLAAALIVPAAMGQDGKTPEAQKQKPPIEKPTAEKQAADKTAPDKAPTEKPAETDAGRYCANVTPSIAEARIAWQMKRLTELDAQVKQRIGELEKAEASAREWVAKRDDLMKAAGDDLVAIYGKMEPENAARQLGAMDDRMAAAILGKLKPNAAGAILGEMEAEKASRLSSLLSGANLEDKKS